MKNGIMERIQKTEEKINLHGIIIYERNYIVSLLMEKKGNNFFLSVYKINEV